MHLRNRVAGTIPSALPIAVVDGSAGSRLGRLCVAAAIAGIVALSGNLTGCASKHPQDDSPTIKDLNSRIFTVPPDQGVVANDDATIAAYREYLKKAPADAQRPEAMRRLGDLEMDRADSRLAGGAPEKLPVPADAAGSTAEKNAKASGGTGGAKSSASASAASSAATGSPAAKGDKLAPSAAPPVASAPGAGKGAIAAPTAAIGEGTADAQNYRGAISMYVELLKNFPTAVDNDKVLYQLAHAYELSGDLENALKVLNRLVKEYPHSSLVDESHFRRGELMFAMHDYRGAEGAYSIILAAPNHTPYFERALYMHGWTLYKQDRLEEALQSFFGVLDLKLIAREADVNLDVVAGLTRADRELVEDTLRVVSLCLENLQGADSIPPYMTSVLRRDYEFRIYRQLGELYLAQERVKDAADTFLAFARRYPLHPQSPVLQARVIEIYQQAGFENLALGAKRDYVGHYRLHGEFYKAKTALLEAFPGLELEVQEITFLPREAKQLDGEAAALFEKFLGMLDDCDDVQEIYHNVSRS